MPLGCRGSQIERNCFFATLGGATASTLVLSVTVSYRNIRKFDEWFHIVKRKQWCAPSPSSGLPSLSLPDSWDLAFESNDAVAATFVVADPRRPCEGATASFRVACLANLALCLILSLGTRSFSKWIWGRTFFLIYSWLTVLLAVLLAVYTISFN
jgi:hypothetical protein